MEQGCPKGDEHPREESDMNNCKAPNGKTNFGLQVDVYHEVQSRWNS